MQVQDLLRFLTQEAKIPLATALSATPALKSSQLDSLDSLAKTKPTTLTPILPDDKFARQVIAAAKRVGKKRAAGEPAKPSLSKRRRDVYANPQDESPADVEVSLDLPSSNEPESELREYVFTTNRAPLLLAFAYVLTKYTLLHLPNSSRWSLAQAVVSEGARKKAQNIGMAGQGAEEEGWGAGQPVFRVMSRDVKILKRWGYSWATQADSSGPDANREVDDDKLAMEVKIEEDKDAKSKVDDIKADEEPAVWAIDLEKLKKLNGPLTFSARGSDTADLPVYSPKAARAYILRSFSSVEAEQDLTKKVTLKAAAIERERNVSRLFQALDMLFTSWADKVSMADLDRRAWGWYVAVRPDVEAGTAGWGAKGQVKLADILGLMNQ